MIISGLYVRRSAQKATKCFDRGDFLVALSSGSKNLVGKAAFVPEDFEEAFGGFCGIRVLMTIHSSSSSEFSSRHGFTAMHHFSR